MARSDSHSEHPSVLLNKISKANRMITEYALEKPEDYGRDAQEIAAGLEQWKAHREQLVVTYNRVVTPDEQIKRQRGF